MTLKRICLLSLGLLAIGNLDISAAFAHEGPDPIAHWRMIDRDVDQTTGKITATIGPNATIRVVNESPRNNDTIEINEERGLMCRDPFAGIVVTQGSPAGWTMPKRDFTVVAWVSVDQPQRWGGIVGQVEDTGSDEAGWILGYNERYFTIGLRGSENDDRMTYVTGRTQYEPGRLYHVAAVYDGELTQLYVNGKLDAQSTSESGDIVYPNDRPIALAAYHDSNEMNSHRGAIREIKLFDLAARPAWVEHDFSHDQRLTSLPIELMVEPLDFIIEPYLQFATQTSITAMCRTNRHAQAVLHYGPTDECEESISVDAASVLHQIRIDSLEPETQYFYRYTLTTENASDGTPKQETIESKVGIFQTAVREQTPFAFAVISDTQSNPTVAGKLAHFAWEQRPSFLLHPGDLVDTGGNDSHWTQQFFPSMSELIRNVPFYPVLGNHEQNARNYFDYVALPDPEFYYTYTFGNTQFFMIDSNRNVDPESEQYQWLDKQLAESRATWKLVCHHHPPYTSDADDYGQLFKTNVSTRGDMRVRKLVPLYEKHNVDLVWNGHIHSYERTWPIREGRAAASGAPIYMITGGGGGSLETPGPIRPFFMNTVRRGHHYSMVRVNGPTLEIQVYDLDNRLFDQLRIEKSVD